MPVSDPENLLKPRGYLKQTTASTSKVSQPKTVQTNAKVPLEQSILEEGYTKIHFRDTSIEKLEAENINPELVLPEIKAEIDSISLFTSKVKRSLSIPSFIDIPLVPKVKVLVPQKYEDYISYPDSTLVGSPVYISCKSEEPSPHFPFPPFLDFLCPNGQFLEPPSPHLEVDEGSLRCFENPLYNSRTPSPRLSMAAAGGGGAGGAGGGGGQGPPPPLPRIFSKVPHICSFTPSPCPS
jgi:hypothetical protein